MSSKRDFVEILHQPRAGQRDLVGDLVRIGRKEGDVAAAAAELDQIGVDHLAADHGIGNGSLFVMLVHASASESGQEVHRLGLSLRRGRTADLVVAALDLADAVDLLFERDRGAAAFAADGPSRR